MVRAISFVILLGALVAMALPLSAMADDPFIPVGASRIVVKVRGATGFLFKPTAGSSKTARPWLWYAPTRLDLPPDHQYPNVRTHWLFSRLLARGVWIAGVDVGESYGGPGTQGIFRVLPNHHVAISSFPPAVLSRPESRRTDGLQLGGGESR